MDQLTRTAYELFPSPKRVRVFLGGQAIADSRRTIFLRTVAQRTKRRKAPDNENEHR